MAVIRPYRVLVQPAETPPSAMAITMRRYQHLFVDDFSDGVPADECSAIPSSQRQPLSRCEVIRRRRLAW